MAFGFFKKKQPEKKVEKKSATTDVFGDFIAAASSKSGIPVNYKTAMQLVTAQACARVIADDIAQLPFKLFLSAPDGGSRPVGDHPVAKLIKLKPNDWQTSFELREQISLHLVFCNNAYIWINRVGGRIVELLPIEPHLVTLTRNEWETTYDVSVGGGKKVRIPKADMWHIRGLSWDGWQGLDGVRLMREAIGLSVALETHGSKMFANGATVGGLLSTDAQMSPEKAKELRQSWEDRHTGADSAYKTAVLWGGMRWTPLGSGNDQSQFLETRRFQVEEVCRAFKIMPIMVGHSDKTTTYASASQMFLAHLRQTINPWLVRIEQSADCNLLTDAELVQGYHTKFVRSAFMATTATERAQFYTSLYNIGAINPNEIRGLEEMNPYEGGDQYRVPLNMENPTDGGGNDNGNGGGLNG